MLAATVMTMRQASRRAAALEPQTPRRPHQQLTALARRISPSSSTSSSSRAQASRGWRCLACLAQVIECSVAGSPGGVAPAPLLPGAGTTCNALADLWRDVRLRPAACSGSLQQRPHASPSPQLPQLQQHASVSLTAATMATQPAPAPTPAYCPPARPSPSPVCTINTRTPDMPRPALPLTPIPHPHPPPCRRGGAHVRLLQRGAV